MATRWPRVARAGFDGGLSIWVGIVDAVAAADRVPPSVAAFRARRQAFDRAHVDLIAAVPAAILSARHVASGWIRHLSHLLLVSRILVSGREGPKSISRVGLRTPENPAELSYYCSGHDVNMMLLAWRGEKLGCSLRVEGAEDASLPPGAPQLPHPLKSAGPPLMARRSFGLHPLGIVGAMATRETRREENQKIFQREEWLHDATVAAGYEAAPVPFLCECADENCCGRVELTPSQWEVVSAAPNHYVMIAGHPRNGVDKVVGSIREYEIARKPV
jgi:hypothetical protein